MSDNLKQITHQLKIKTGVVKRLKKEVKLYQEEYDEQKAVKDDLEAKGGDEWAIKNAQKVLKDCEQMLPGSKERYEEAYDALKDLVQATNDEEGVSSTPEHREAKKLVEEGV